MNIRRTRSSERRALRTRRTLSTLTAAAVLGLMVFGSGAAFADDTPTPAPSAPTSPDPSSNPASQPPTSLTPPSSPASAPADVPPAPAASSTPKAPSSPSSPSAPTSPTAPKTGTSVTTIKSAASSVSAPPRTSHNTSLLQALVPLSIPCVGGPATVVGGFEIDGNTCAQGFLDWDTTGQTVVDGFGDSTTFAGGTSEGDDPAGWALGGPSPNGKTDIGQVWAYSHVAGDVFAYFGLTNNSTSGGTSQYDVEYNQLDPVGGMPNRSPGDLLFRFSSTGSDPIQFTDAKKWTLKTDSAWGVGCQSITTTSGWCTIPIPAGVFAQSVSADGTFFEGAINISLLFGSGNCTGNFGSVDIRSVTGNSFYSSSLKDYVTPLSVDTPSTCGRIVINKKDENGVSLSGATFSVSPNPDPTKASNTPYSITDNGPADKNSADGIIEIDPVTPGVTYTVTETQAPAGHLLDNPLGDSTNPQLVDIGSTATFNFTDHAIWQPLTISKTATPHFGASYAWSIQKQIALSPNGPWSSVTTNADPLKKLIPDNSADPGTLYYRTVVTEGAETTSAYTVTGTISVGNPNTAGVQATIADSLPGGTCTIAGDPSPVSVTVPAGGHDYSYTCSLGDNPAPADITGLKNNHATVTWSKADYPQVVGDLNSPDSNVLGADASYQFGAPTSTQNASVTISDDQTNALDGTTYTWSAEGTTHTSAVYSTSTATTPGTCTGVIKNTASVIGDSATVLDSDSAYGQICLGSDLTITGMDAETLTRTYPWSISKSSSTPKVYVHDGKATLDYTVTTTAGAGVDSAWLISGTITVHNPNLWEPVSVTSLPVSYDSGLPVDACSVTGETFPVQVAANADHVFNYTCSFTGQPDYNGTVSATANWDAAAANTPTGSASKDLSVFEADWGITPVNATVTVHDDNGTPGDTSDDTTRTLNWADVWAMPNHQDVYNYSVDLTGDQLPALGTCADRTNTVSVTGDDDVVLDPNGTEDNSVTDQVCNPYTQISVKKVDAETGAPLAGAVFSLSQGETQLGTATSGDDGTAVFDAKLVAGTYTVTETQAPDGYSLPPSGGDTVIVTIDDISAPDSNFVENGVMPAIVFSDPANGQIAIVSKQHFERDLATNNWVPSDGAVDFGQEVRYVVNVTATGKKLFHNVTVTDYVPGYNPADTTSTGKSVLEPSTVTCGGGFTCTATEDMTTGLVTWTLTSTGQAPGDVVGGTSGDVEMTVTMPALPDSPPYVNGVYDVIEWNQGYLGWDQTDFVPAPELQLARNSAVVPQSTHHSLTSNEVTDEARALEPSAPTPSCSDPNPPASLHCKGEGGLPNTGGPSPWILYLALALTLGGVAILAGDRRHWRRS